MDPELENPSDFEFLEDLADRLSPKYLSQRLQSVPTHFRDTLDCFARPALPVVAYTGRETTGYEPRASQN